MEISLQDHFQNNELCKKNHDREQQIIYIKCPGPCTKTYFKFGKSIEMHLKNSKCSKEVPLTLLPQLKKEFQEFQTKRRKIQKQRYYFQNKSKRQKTTPPSPPRDEHVKENEDLARNSESSDDSSTKDATEESDISDDETSGDEKEIEHTTENSDESGDESDDESSSKEICRGCSRVCESPHPNPGYNSILGTLHKPFGWS